MNWTVTATKARRDFFTLLSKTDKPGTAVTITVDGIPKAVMLSVQDFDGWQETLEIMSDRDLLSGIKAGLKDISEGNTLYTEEEARGKFNI